MKGNSEIIVRESEEGTTCHILEPCSLSQSPVTRHGTSPLNGKHGDDFDLEKNSHTSSPSSRHSASNDKADSSVDEDIPPDGGLNAWTQVACGWMVLFATWGYVNSFGAFQTYYTSTLGESPSVISWIGSIQVFLTFFIGTFSGRMLDGGLFIPTFMTGIILQLIGIFSMSFSRTYWQLVLTQGLLTGIGNGIMFCPAIGLVVTYFDRHRAMAVALATTGNSTGGIVYPLIVRELLPQLGFAWTTRVLGFLNLGGFIFVIIFMRPRLPPRKAGPLVDMSAFRDVPYMLFTAGIFFIQWASYFVFYFIASFGVDSVHMSYSSATTLLIIVNGIGIPARILPPLLADRYTGVLNMFVPVLLATTVLSYGWIGVTTPSGFYAWTCIYGLVNSAYQCLIPTGLSTMTTDLQMTGTRLGMAFSFVGVGALTGPPVGGALVEDGVGGYLKAQVWVGTACLVGTGLVAAARVSKCGWKMVKC